MKTNILFDGPLPPRTPPGRFAPLAESAFRALGLTCAATQREVFDAASSLRLALKVGVEKRFAADLGWLAPVARAESDLRDALGRLSDPAGRARERLFWFHSPVEAAPPASVAELAAAAGGLLAGEAGEGAAGEGRRGAVRHDAALLLLAGLHRLDPTLAETEVWGRAFRLWREVCEDESFWSRLVAADLKGGFEPAVNFGEVAALRSEVPRLVSSAVAERAKSAAVGLRVAEAGRAFSLLRAASLPAQLLAEYEGDVVGPFEDRCEERCLEAFSLVEYFNRADAEVSRRLFFGKALARVEGGLKPALRDLLEVGGAESPGVRRAFADASRRIRRLAEGYDDLQGEARTAAALHELASAIAPPGSPEAEEAAARDAAADGRKAAANLSDEAGAGAWAGGARHFAAGALAALRRERPEWLEKESLAQSRQGQSAGWLATLLFYSAVVASCFLCQWMGFIKSGPGRRAPQPVDLIRNYNFSVVSPTVAPPDFKPLRLAPRVSAAQLRGLIESRAAVVVDVRSRAEYDAGRLPGAVWMPEGEVRKRYRSVQRGGRRVVFYCDCPGDEEAERVAREVWIRAGANVAVLEGGYQAWLAEEGASKTLPGPRSVKGDPRPAETVVEPPRVLTPRAPAGRTPPAGSATPGQ